MNARTAGSATSASSSATRISRAVASMSASDNRPLPRREEKTLSRRLERVSNTKDPVLRREPATGDVLSQVRRHHGRASPARPDLLERLAAAFARPDPNDLVDRDAPDLAVADAAGTRGGDHRFDHLVDEHVVDEHL